MCKVYCFRMYPKATGCPKIDLCLLTDYSMQLSGKKCQKVSSKEEVTGNRGGAFSSKFTKKRHKQRSCSHIKVRSRQKENGTIKRIMIGHLRSCLNVTGTESFLISDTE